MQPMHHGSGRGYFKVLDVVAENCGGELFLNLVFLCDKIVIYCILLFFLLFNFSL